MNRFFLVAALLLATSFKVRADAVDPGFWYEFSFTDVGVEARGCFPEDLDPSALDCVPSSASNSRFAPAPPWTFTLTAPARITVTDAFLHGDSFDVFDSFNGGPAQLIFSTPLVTADGAGCGDNPEVCVRDIFASHARFLLDAGRHAITIRPTAIADAGAAYFFIVPEPGSASLAGIAGAIGFFLARMRRMRGVNCD
jgi:hypothetical protein